MPSGPDITLTLMRVVGRAQRVQTYPRSATVCLKLCLCCQASTHEGSSVLSGPDVTLTLVREVVCPLVVTLL